MQSAENNLIIELKRENFELGMIEQYDACGFGIFQLIGIKNIVWLSATAIYGPQPAALGIKYPLSYLPGTIHCIKLFGF